jgi:hypothetical protein
MGKGLGVGQIVDGDKLDSFFLYGSPKDRTSDPTETVYSYS